MSTKLDCISKHGLTVMQCMMKFRWTPGCL